MSKLQRRSGGDLLRGAAAVAGAFAALFCVAPTAHAAKFQLEYEASIMNVVTLGRASFSGDFTATQYALVGTLATSGLAQMFDDTRITARTTGALATGLPRWARYDLEHNYARKSRRVAMAVAGGGVTATITPRYGNMGTPPATLAQQAASTDPLTALASMSLTVGRSRACAGVYPVFDGRQHYTLTLTPSSRGTYRGGGYDGAAIVCAVRYTPVAGFTPMTAQERARIPAGTMWFADPAVAGIAALLRIAVPTPLGEGRIDVKRFEVTP